MIKLPLISTSEYIAKCPKHWRLVRYRQYDYDRYNFYPEPCSKCNHEARVKSIADRRAQGRVIRKENKGRWTKAYRNQINMLKELYVSDDDLAYNANSFTIVMPKGSDEE